MTGKLIAIEGADGVGKRTVSRTLTSILKSVGARVQEISFPGYTETSAGGLIGEILAKRRPMPKTQEIMAGLYALDRLELLPILHQQLAEADFVISDRYVASNIAYQVAIGGEHDFERLTNWISKLEFGLFGMPTPHLNVLIDTSQELSIKFQTKKNRRLYTSETFDRYEEDASLQLRVRSAYQELVKRKQPSSWLVVQTECDGVLRAPAEIAGEIIRQLGEFRKP